MSAAPLAAAVPTTATPTYPYHVMAKPIGPKCNLDCEYCFYLEKEQLYQDTRRWQMDDATLERYIEQYIVSQNSPDITFAWQGGEPTLMGVSFFGKVVALQQRYAGDKRIANAFQTNGTLLTDAWCELFRQHDFLLGISIDGPPTIHNHYRKRRNGSGSHHLVRRGLDLLRKHGVEFNTLTVVNRHNSQYPLDVYRYLVDIGSTYLQFIPLVERQACGASSLAAPPQQDADLGHAPVTEWSVRPADYGRFMSQIWDHWVRRDVGKVFVNLFDQQLAVTVGQPAGICVFSPECGRAMAMEHNGDLYSCDHFVYPEYYLGNVNNTELATIVDQPRQQAFGKAKRDTLPGQCRRCRHLQRCWGECPKHRFGTTDDGEAGLAYLCQGYQAFFDHAEPDLKRMAQLLQQGRAPAEIMHERRLAGTKRASP